MTGSHCAERKWDERTNSLDLLFDLLSKSARRRVLETLITTDEVPETTVLDAVPDAASERLRVRLEHTDLPKLEAAGLITRNRESGLVRRGPEYDTIRPLLEALDDASEDLPGEWP